MTPPLSILLLGNANRAEFRDARLCLDHWATVVGFSDVVTAATALAEGRVAPDLIVIAQAFPGQFSHAAIDHLRRLAPLARIVGLLGSWCEGEMRSGSPWPGVVRTYWHQWATRGNREFRRMAVGQRCPWALPPTATEEERLLADMAGTTELPPPCGLMLIHTHSTEMAQWLSAACRHQGFATVWQRPSTTCHVGGATGAIFDTSDLGEDEYDALQRLARMLHPAPVIAVLGFPRIEDQQRALAAGATTVLSKPLALEDLFAEIEKRMVAA